MTDLQDARDGQRPKVSVCVVTYNQRDYIGECLESIVTQRTDFPFEVIVGDDASTDGTTDIVRDYAQRYPDLIRPVFHEKNVGPFENYRVVHRMARGEYVAHVDGDDYWLSGKLAAQVEFLDRNPDCGAVYTNAIVVNGIGKVVGLFNNEQKEKFDLNYLLSGKNFLNHSSMMYRSYLKNLLIEIENEFIDYQVHLRFSANRQMGYINKCLTAYRILSKNSMVGNYPSKIKELYWNALSDDYIKDIILKNKSRYIEVFLSDIYFNSFRNLNIRHAIFWTKKVTENQNMSIALIITNSLILSVKILIQKIIASLKMASIKSGKRIYYFR